MIDEDVAMMKAATKKPRALVKMSDTRWNVLYAVLRRFRALNPAMQLLYANLRSVSIDAAKVRFTCTRFCFFAFSSFNLVVVRFPPVSEVNFVLIGNKSMKSRNGIKLKS
jgi:hypothetical protein